MRPEGQGWRQGWLGTGALLVGALVLSAVVGAETLEEVINPKQARHEWVSDMAGVIDNDTQRRLNALIDHLEQQTSAEIAVVSIWRTDGRTPKEFATALLNLWGVGKQGKDNGILVLLVLESRRIEVETGYGVESILPDGKVGEILRTHVVPRFKQGDFGGGLLAGVQRMASVIAGEPLEETSRSPVQPAFPLVATSPRRSSPVLRWLLVFVGMPVLGLVLMVVGYAIKQARVRYCSQCHRKMRRLTEAQDDAYLAVDQKFEEELGSVDYRVWRCDDCQLCTVERVVRWSKGYEDCPQCQHRTVRVLSQTLLEPTVEREGKKAVTRTCRSQHCNWQSTAEEVIARRVFATTSSTGWSHSGSGGGGSGGSFGGGSSGGGGAGSSW
jgi:uncharacterized protein